MILSKWSSGEGQRCRDGAGEAEGCRGGHGEVRGDQGWTKSSMAASMGTNIHPARNVFGQMAARTHFENFCKLKFQCYAINI